MKRIMCQKGLAMIRPYSRRWESAYILSYQSLFSVSINRASPEGDNPKCAKEGLAQTSYRGGYQKRPGVLEFCQPQLADCLATLLFPYREVGIELPTTLKRWQNPGKPGSGWIKQMPTRKQSLPWQNTLKLGRNDSECAIRHFEESRSKPSKLDSLIHCHPLVDSVIYILHGIVLFIIGCDNDFDTITPRHKVQIGGHCERD